MKTNKEEKTPPLIIRIGAMIIIKIAFFIRILTK